MRFNTFFENKFVLYFACFNSLVVEIKPFVCWQGPNWHLASASVHSVKERQQFNDSKPALNVISVLENEGKFSVAVLYWQYLPAKDEFSSKDGMGVQFHCSKRTVFNKRNTIEKLAKKR